MLSVPYNDNQTLASLAMREPVAIDREGQPVAYVISHSEYERLARVNMDRFATVCHRASQEAAEKGLTPDILDGLLREIR